MIFMFAKKKFDEKSTELDEKLFIIITKCSDEKS